MDATYNRQTNKPVPSSIVTMSQACTSAQKHSYKLTQEKCKCHQRKSSGADQKTPTNQEKLNYNVYIHKTILTFSSENNIHKAHDPVLRKLRQEDCKLKVGTGYTVRLLSEANINNN